MLTEPRCVPHVSLDRVCRPTLRFPPQGPPGRVPQLQRYYQGATTSCRPSRRTSLPSLGGTSAFTRSFRSPADECAAEAWSWSPGISGRDFAEETTGSPKFLGNPDCPFAHVQSTPAGLLAPDHYGAAAWPLVIEQQRLPRKVFRRSIAWLSDSLSTLRSAGYPATTQDSLPAAGQALPDGLSTRRVPMKGFRSASYISSSFPKLAWRNQIDRSRMMSPCDMAHDEDGAVLGNRAPFSPLRRARSVGPARSAKGGQASATVLHVPRETCSSRATVRSDSCGSTPLGHEGGNSGHGPRGRLPSMDGIPASTGIVRTPMAA